MTDNLVTRAVGAIDDFRFIVSVRFEPDARIFKMVLTPLDESEQPNETVSVDSRFVRAAKWVLYLDSRRESVLRSGHATSISIPDVQTLPSGRPVGQTLGDYRRLRLKTEALLYPLFQPNPSFEELYPYQADGVEWLLSRKRGILADDMGLGKTIQVISAIRVLFHSASLRRALIMAPKGLMANWEYEFSRWSPELGVAVITPGASIREDAWKALVERRHVLITNYEQLRDPPRILLERVPELIVADEAHRLRNRESQVTLGSVQLRSDRFWALTGTPLERDIEDFATLLSMVDPDKFSPEDSRLHPTSLRSRARPYIMRRRKQDVLSQLPKVIETEETLELTDKQQEAYRNSIAHYRRNTRPGNDLALLTRLLAICDIETEGHTSCKIDRILDLLRDIYAVREKAVVFSHRLAALRQLRDRINQLFGAGRCIILTGEMDALERERAVSRFRSDESVIALLASSRVGGEGLTLVEANHVLFVNLWWNPSANQQARDRVVRIGQQRIVQVYRFFCQGTVEESLKQILEVKKSLFIDTIEKLADAEVGICRRVLAEVGIESLLRDEHRSSTLLPRTQAHRLEAVQTGSKTV